MRLYEQGFMGVFYFNDPHGLENGLKKAEAFLNQKRVTFDLRACLVEVREEGDTLSWLFLLDYQTTASIGDFESFAVALHRLRLFSPCGEIGCWLKVNGQIASIRTVVAYGHFDHA